MSLNFGEFVAVGSMSAAVNMVDDACGGRRATLIASEGGWESLTLGSRAKFGRTKQVSRTTRANRLGKFSLINWASCQTLEFW